MRDLTDEALILAVRRGEIRAFDELYRRYADRLFAYVLRYVTDRAEAEDLLQEVFMTVLKDQALELRPGQVGGWFFTVAKNRALSRVRRRRTEEKHRPEPPAPIETPEANAERRELVARVELAVEGLPPPQAEALMLKVVGGLTYAQIASVQDVPEGTAKSRLHHAIRAVRAFFARDHEGEIS